MKPRHEERDAGGGRFKRSRSCDACGKPVGTEHMSDAEVCGSTDGPGFFLCARVRCEKMRDALSVEDRRALYTAVRSGALAAKGPVRHHLAMADWTWGIEEKPLVKGTRYAHVRRSGGFFNEGDAPPETTERVMLDVHMTQFDGREVLYAFDDSRDAMVGPMIILGWGSAADDKTRDRLVAHIRKAHGL